jgi:hypothetical protein
VIEDAFYAGDVIIVHNSHISRRLQREPWEPCASSSSYRQHPASHRAVTKQGIPAKPTWVKMGPSNPSGSRPNMACTSSHGLFEATSQLFELVKGHLLRRKACLSRITALDEPAARKERAMGDVGLE